MPFGNNAALKNWKSKCPLGNFALNGAVNLVYSIQQARFYINDKTKAGLIKGERPSSYHRVGVCVCV